MGYYKQLEEQNQHKREIAIQIAIEAEVLERCEYHEECTFEGGVDISEAYKLGNKKFTNGELLDIFESRREMTDLIKEVVEESPLECSRCDHLLNAD